MTYKPASKLAERTYKALKLLNYDIQTEVTIGSRLRIDFVLKELKIAIEVDGSQHSQFNAFFHDSKYAFKDQQKRDRKKEELASREGLTLIRLSEKEIMEAASPQKLLALILAKVNDARTQGESEW